MRVTQILRAIATWRPSYQHSLQFPANRIKLFTACRKAAAECRFSLLASDVDAGTIMTQASRATIQIIVDENSVVHARSQSLVYPFTLSYGVSWWPTHRANIDKLFYAIEKTLGRGPGHKPAAAHESAPTARSKPNAR